MEEIETGKAGPYHCDVNGLHVDFAADRLRSIVCDMTPPVDQLRDS